MAKKISRRLIALSTSAIATVYLAGLWQTRAATDQSIQGAVTANIVAAAPVAVASGLATATVTPSPTLAPVITASPPSTRRQVDQVWLGALVALAACLAQFLGAGQSYLLIGLLIGNLALAIRRDWGAGNRQTGPKWRGSDPVDRGRAGAGNLPAPADGPEALPSESRRGDLVAVER